MRVFLVLAIVLAASGCFGTSAPPSAPSDAPLIPALSSPILLDRNASATEWDGATRRIGQMQIDWNGSVTTYPFEVKLGSYGEKLFMFVRIENLSAPSPLPRQENAMYPDSWEVFLARGANDVDAITFSSIGGYSTHTDDSWWNGAAWVLQDVKTEFQVAKNGAHSGATVGRAWAEDDGDALLWEIVIAPGPHEVDLDALRSGDELRLAVNFFRQGEWQGRAPMPHGHWPADAEPERGPSDIGSWLRFRLP